MEVYRYTIPTEYRKIDESGFLTSWDNQNRRPLYTLPQDPLLWGLDDTRNLLKWIERISGQHASILMMFDINITDASSPIYVQEGCVQPWFKNDSKKHISLYSRNDYEKPEVLIWTPIPKQQIKLVDFPELLVENA